MVEAVSMSETSVSFCRTTRRNIPEDNVAVLMLAHEICLYQQRRRFPRAVRRGRYMQVAGPAATVPRPAAELRVSGSRSQGRTTLLQAALLYRRAETGSVACTGNPTGQSTDSVGSRDPKVRSLPD
jgi:hypothetical protein